MAWLSASHSHGRLVAHESARVRRPSAVETGPSRRYIAPHRKMGAVADAALLQNPTCDPRAEFRLAGSPAAANEEADGRDDERHRHDRIRSGTADDIRR